MVQVIRTESDYETALKELDALMDLDPEAGTEDANKLEVLAVLIEDYERKAYPIDAPDPIEAIKFRMEQEGLSQRDLIPIIGSRSKVSEVLSRKRSLSLSMIRGLHDSLGIPASVLLGQEGVERPPAEALDWQRFPIKELTKLGWIPTLANVKGDAESALRQYLSILGPINELASLYRRETHVRSARNFNKYALLAWTARVVERASLCQPSQDFAEGSVDLEFMRKVARLSWSETGPKLAQEYLSNHGICLIIVQHLSRTYLDGATVVSNECPIIGMTIRHDRIDSFWFTLMHELAHLALHADRGKNFYDDLDAKSDEKMEREADKLARDALVPQDEWATSVASRLHTPEAVVHLARKIGVHPAIVAGRVRWETGAYQKLSQMVGHRCVRNLFDEFKEN